MADPDPHLITRLLGDVRAGDKAAENELAALVYDDLLRVAMQRMGRQPGLTLEPAALVNECWLRLAEQRNGFDCRSQFFAVASRVMVRVMVDAQRRRMAEKRGGALERVTLSFEVAESVAEVGVEVERLQEALDRLQAVQPRKAEAARLRGLVGLTTEEAAAELGVAVATVERDWSFARAWLSREVQRLAGDAAESPDS